MSEATSRPTFLANSDDKTRPPPRLPAFRAKAPVRISFAGGGTDVSPFPETEGGVVLSATIDRYAHASLSPHELGHVRVESVDYGMSIEMKMQGEFEFNGDLDLVKAAIRRVWREEEPGYTLLSSSAAPPGSGLGSSSAMIVAIVAVLNEYYGIAMSDYEVARTASVIERNDLGIVGGLQDHYAASFGGFNFIEFTDQVIVNPLRIRPDTVAELEMNLMLCYLGTTRRSDGIISDQTERLKSADPETLEGLRTQKELAVAMKVALLRDELEEFGWLLGQAWDAKKKMSPKISNEFIDEAYSTALDNGAIGGKVTGAGGGGYILFYVDFERRHRVSASLERLGVTVSSFAFASEGVRTWRR
jgi:D-glycero-alpha-D-manno-heptose-7-phosphate kinase